MKQSRMITSARSAAGFTLLELLLTVGLLGLLLAGMYGILNSWGERAVNRQAASDMLRLRTAAHDYVLASFDDMRADVPNVFTEIDVDDLKPGNFLQAGYQPINAYKQRMRIFKRNLQTPKLNPDGTVTLDAAGNAVILTTIEVVVIADNPPGDTIRTGNKRLIDAASAGGPAMGVMADMVLAGNSFANRVTSLYQQWFISTAALNAAGYSATPDTQGGYLAAYDLVSSETTEANDHWLYRVQIDGRPELNRMATDLNMNANELQNVGTIIADKYNVEGNAAFRGQAQGAAAETAQGMTVEQALRIDTVQDVRINMKTSTAGCSFSGPDASGNRTLVGAGCTMSGGEFQTVGEAVVDPATGVATSVAGDARLRVTDTMTAQGNVISDFTNVTNAGGTALTDVAGISTFDTIDGAAMQTSTTALAPTTNVTGVSVLTDQFQAGNMGVSNGASIMNQLVMARAEPGLTHRFQTNQMVVGNVVQLDGRLGASEAITASNTLYLDNANTTTNPRYNDPSMPTRAGAPRQVVCVPWGGRTYCEPRGETSYNINGQTIYDDCRDNGAGYTCDYYRTTQLYGVQRFGDCTFIRSTGTSGQAYHSYTCN
jgi:prepilin-type N-terminal cleavage/methylation domain-containing protein